MNSPLLLWKAETFTAKAYGEELLFPRTLGCQVCWVQQGGISPAAGWLTQAANQMGRSMPGGALLSPSVGTWLRESICCSGASLVSGGKSIACYLYFFNQFYCYFLLALLFC